MATLTITDQPDLYTPVYNPMRFVVNSTNYTQTNFKYVADVYVSGVSATYVFRGTYDPDPNHAYQCAIDISRILEGYVTSNINDTSGANFTRCSNTYSIEKGMGSYVSYEVKFGEQYGSTPVTYPNIAVTGLKYAWNASLPYDEFQSFDYTLYTVGMGSTLLTNQSDTQYWSSRTSNAYLTFINDVSGAAYFAKINLYDTSGSNIGTWKITNTYQASSAYTDKMISIDVGLQQIYNSSNIYSQTAVPNILNVDKYDVTLINWAGTNTSQTITYQYRCPIKGQAEVNIAFMNRLGGFDSFNFFAFRKYSYDVNRTTYQRTLGKISGTTWGYNVTDAGTTVMNTEVTDKYQLHSDWINDSDAAWLEELVESPEVYAHKSNILYPVIIKTSNYMSKTILQDKLFNLVLDVEFANKRWRQRG